MRGTVVRVGLFAGAIGLCAASQAVMQINFNTSGKFAGYNWLSPAAGFAYASTDSSFLSGFGKLNWEAGSSSLTATATPDIVGGKQVGLTVNFAIKGIADLSKTKKVASELDGRFVLDMPTTTPPGSNQKHFFFSLENTITKIGVMNWRVDSFQILSTTGGFSNLNLTALNGLGDGHYRGKLSPSTTGNFQLYFDSAVPEPMTLALCLGGLGLAVIRRRRKN